MYYSQCQQDQYLNEKYFKNKTNGFFVDVGAYDGVTGSNSLFFEESLDWSGICIEPLPEIYDNLIVNRSSDNIKCAIDVEEGKVDFIRNTGYTEQISGIAKYYDKRHYDRLLREIDGLEGDGGVHPGAGNTETIVVNTMRLETIFDEHDVSFVDYLSVDVEGAELQVMKSVDYDNVHVDIIGFEDNFPDNSMKVVEFLQSIGFGMLGKLGYDIFMVNEKSKHWKET